VGELCFRTQLRYLAAKCLNARISDPANNSLERTGDSAAEARVIGRAGT
jgi:hypothetical protein